MNNSKMQLNNTNSNSNNVNMNNNGNLKLPQWQQQQQHPLANYTLPGVINYLTSEFTDLERFKIMTNLEKSEMKYKIVQLQGELNSLRYINEKQKSRINVLERENQKFNQLKHEGAECQSERGIKKEHTITEDDIEIPEIDLLEIKKSRTQLTKSMKQVLHLLKTPHANNMNILNLSDPADELSEYEELIKDDKSDSFCFSEKNNTEHPNYSGQSRKYNKDRMFSQYLNDIPFNSQNQGQTESIKDNLNPNNLTEIGDINAKSIQYLTEPSEEKEAFPSSSYKGEESDAETVIMDDSDGEKLELTKTKSNHAKQLDPNSTATSFSPTLSNLSLESNSTTAEDACSIKPNALVTTNDPNYAYCRVFTTCLNNTIVYLNYEHNLDEKMVLLNVWSTSMNKVVVSKEFTDTIVEKPTNILDIYCVSHDETNLTVYLLIIYKSGTVDHIRLNENSQITKSCVINFEATSLNSSRFIEFNHKSNPEPRNFGLVVTGLLKPGLTPFIKVYNLMIDTKNSIIDNEIGSYVKSFFKLSNLQEPDMFEAVHWFKNDEAKTVVDASSPKSNKAKSHKRTISCTDVSLSPYEIILKLGYQLIRFNFVLKKYHTLIDEQQCDLIKDVCFNDHLAVFAEVKEDNFRLKVYDLVKKTSLSETNFNSSFSENSDLILVSDQKKYAIARLDRTHIQFYDLNFSLLHHINISPLPNTLFYANGEIILATMSNNSTENLAIYDLNTFTA